MMGGYGYGPTEYDMRVHGGNSLVCRYTPAPNTIQREHHSGRWLRSAAITRFLKEKSLGADTARSRPLRPRASSCVTYRCNGLPYCKADPAVVVPTWLQLSRRGYGGKPRF